jgi:hypothetical protein
MRKHAGARGSRNINAALTEAQALAIIGREGKDSAATLAGVYGVSAETIRRIWRGENWGWLQEAGAEQPTDRPAEALPQATPEDAAAAAESLKRLQARLAESVQRLPDAPADMLKELKDDGSSSGT